MELFDVSQFELPKLSEVDWQQTYHNVGVFLSVYQRSRERMGLPAVPQLSAMGQLNEADNQLAYSNLNQFDRKEFENCQQCFHHGFYGIVHPFRPEVTKRRRKIFIFRYLHGLSILSVSERIHYQKNIIVSDSKMAMLQFSVALRLLVLLTD